MRRGLLSCVQFWAHILPPTLRGQELQSSLGAGVNWPMKGAPCTRGPSITITTADVTDPTKQPGPQMQGNPNPTSD